MQQKKGCLKWNLSFCIILFVLTSVVIRVGLFTSSFEFESLPLLTPISTSFIVIESNYRTYDDYKNNSYVEHDSLQQQLTIPFQHLFGPEVVNIPKKLTGDNYFLNDEMFCPLDYDTYAFHQDLDTYNGFYKILSDLTVQQLWYLLLLDQNKFVDQNEMIQTKVKQYCKNISNVVLFTHQKMNGIFSQINQDWIAALFTSSYFKRALIMDGLWSYVDMKTMEKYNCLSHRCYFLPASLCDTNEFISSYNINNLRKQSKPKTYISLATEPQWIHSGNNGRVYTNYQKQSSPREEWASIEQEMLSPNRWGGTQSHILSVVQIHALLISYFLRMQPFIKELVDHIIIRAFTINHTVVFPQMGITFVFFFVG
ncbi:hypothetical protein RFI_30394 [Reticulomyxa filosa]|uniref:Uncharacterized protein n=1 Tax=Reticulomyxa filosa TaxID=46433 RepID=X6M0R6_RETFI|nr:hypothetical protein RFI_30394 [Reticulomyxa filosa]|eukprot:ETO06997.1 hypothetical protein RFI_30394 [Reticulomyxa filosa]